MNNVGVVTWLDPDDCDPPHGLDLTTAHDVDKVNMLAKAFSANGFDKTKSTLVGYPLNGKVQLLSGTHRHLAAKLTNIKIPVVLWLRSDIEKAWGELEAWMIVIKDIPVAELETWTREQIEAARPKLD